MIVRRWGTAERLQFGIYGCFKICLWNRITFLLIFFWKGPLGGMQGSPQPHEGHLAQPYH